MTSAEAAIVDHAFRRPARNDSVQSALAAHVREFVGSQIFDRVLHLGCGDCSLTVRLPGKELYGVDEGHHFSPTHELPQLHALKAPLLRPCEVVTGPFPLVVITDVLCHSRIGGAVTVMEYALGKLTEPGSLLITIHDDAHRPSRLAFTLLDGTILAVHEANYLIELYVR